MMHVRRGKGERVSGPTETEGVMVRKLWMDEGGKRGSKRRLTPHSSQTQS